MNQWLASIYGTGGFEDDLEKTAQAHLLSKLAEEEGLDLSGLSQDQLDELAQQVLADPDVPQNQAAQQPLINPAFLNAQTTQEAYGDMAVKEAQAKFEEADLLGRVMAHAYTQEIEKIAGSHPRAGVGRVIDRAKHRAGVVAETVKGKARAVGGSMKARTAEGSSSRIRKAYDHVKRNKGAYGAGAGFAGGVAAGRMSKEASAFEKLAEMQAAEILSASGFDPSTGVDMTQQNNGQAVEQGGSEDFQSSLDNRALEMLAEAGYNVDEILARLS